MVNNTSISNLEKEQFVNTWAPFITSTTDAPASSTRVPGMLWFKRGEGRLYMWQTQLPIVSAGNVGTFFFEGECGAAWQCISDRKEIYARCWNAQNKRTSSGNLRGYGIVCADYGTSLPDVRWLLGGANPHVQGPEITWHSGKFWASTTNYTVALDHVVGGMYHDIGYRRVPLDPTKSGPGYGWLAWADYLTTVDTAGYDPYMQDIGTARVIAQITHSGPPQLETDTGASRGLAFWWPEATRTQWGEP